MIRMIKRALIFDQGPFFGAAKALNAAGKAAE